MSKDAKNQCQGCQAGWTLEECNMWSEYRNPIFLHKVEGGYRGERVMCTATYYEKKEEERQDD